MAKMNNRNVPYCLMRNFSADNGSFCLPEYRSPEYEVFFNAKEEEKNRNWELDGVEIVLNSHLEFDWTFHQSPACVAARVVLTIQPAHGEMSPLGDWTTELQAHTGYMSGDGLCSQR